MQAYDPYSIGDRFAPGDWQRPATCGPNGANCVEVNLADRESIGLRDGKLPGSPVLVFDAREWEDFVASVRAGQFG
ncbi:DUF397 domain-containing protein [Amycolatopsis magusensis]|uniref:DUF397 domain-containing protein n=1 Tax=Amycolatopsis magusensis TaxID=882444 RepID=A0ABS4PPX4_9PSEU|nr:DUF397 domain-containing protein [Amycolatopsis magusensis]MBP2180950.1 hypothetical protein [Amycolatopsis magusensis]MDI5981698.1 DUF397 domain-containing protein [Amycolatopsis magusensis]